MKLYCSNGSPFARKVRIVLAEKGLACEVEEGPWKFSVGMTEKYGGQNNGPNPGVYGRAALGACLAIGYGMWAARLEIPIRGLTVEIRAREPLKRLA